MLDKQTLKTGLKNLAADMRTKDVDDDDTWANRLADLLEAFIKSGEVKTGIQVRTTGNAAAQTGATTSTGKIE